MCRRRRLSASTKRGSDPLLGDKTWSALFDNSKVKRVAGPFEASEDLDEILHNSVRHAKERLKTPPPGESDEDRLIEQDHRRASRRASVRTSAK